MHVCMYCRFNGPNPPLVSGAQPDSKYASPNHPRLLRRRAQRAENIYGIFMEFLWKT